MTALTKPGVDWPDIKRRYEGGESASAIAKDGAGVTKQAILKRMHKEGWSRPDKWLTIAKEATAHPDPGSKSAQMVAHWGKRTPENAAAILAHIESGLTQGRAANRTGLSRDMLQDWKKTNPDFAAQIEAAEAAYTERHIGNLNAASDRGDVKAATWMLERHPASRVDFGGGPGSTGGGPQIVVQINVPRDQPHPSDAHIIDVTEAG